MTPTYRRLEAGFSTADAEHPTLEWKGGELVLRFVDWRGQLVSIGFLAVVAFRWEDEAELPVEIRDDTSYEVIESPWAASLKNLGAIDDSGQARHYKLCFNGHGVFDVVSGSLELGDGSRSRSAG